MKMKVFMTKSQHLYSLSIQHLQGWMECIAPVIETDDCPFDSTEELALQLDRWRMDFQKRNPTHNESIEPVIIIQYAQQVILICNQKTGEYIKITVIPNIQSKSQ